MNVPASEAAPLTRQEFVTQLERAAQRLDTLPVTTAMLRALAEVLKQGEPSWWLKTMKAWERRRFVAWNEAWGLFLTAVHYEALRDPENPLVPYFPSCGGTPEADPSRALMRFLNEAEDSFYERLRHGYRRNYIHARASFWMIGAAFFQKRRLPYYLIETDAGAGLNLIPPAESGVKEFDSDLVLARIGLDPEPLSLEDISQRRWLTAALFPDSVEAIQQMDAASERLLQMKRSDVNFVQLAPCSAELAPAFVRKNVPVEADAGLLLYNMGATARMTDLEYQAYSVEMARTLKEWGGRALWLEMESVRGELYSTTYQLRLHRADDGTLRTFIGATLDVAAHKAEVQTKALEDFLS